MTVFFRSFFGDPGLLASLHATCISTSETFYDSPSDNEKAAPPKSKRNAVIHRGFFQSFLLPLLL